MTSIADQDRYLRKLAFFKKRMDTCLYRFHDMIQTRRKQVPRLLNQAQNQSLQVEVQSRVLGSTNRFINCLVGEHYSQDIPEFLQEKASAYHAQVYTRLAPKFVLEDGRLQLLEAIFKEVDGK